MKIIRRSKRPLPRRAVAGNSETRATKRAMMVAPRFLVRLVGRAKAACLFNTGPIYSRHD